METDFSNIELLIDQKDIKIKIIELAQKIDADYKDQEIIILMILKGSFVFTADFIREIKTAFSIETLKCSSYGQKGTHRGKLTIQGLENLDLKSKNVLIIDDIFDSGHTLTKVISEVTKQSPKSVKSLVLLVKKMSQKLKNIKNPDYFLFEIEDKFVIGYGLDYKEYFRGLKGIYSIH
jgi:hypoxanthine phosphoribosyltransferase